MPMFPENSMSLKGREGTFPEIHCTMSRPISKNAMNITYYTGLYCSPNKIHLVSITRKKYLFLLMKHLFIFKKDLFFWCDALLPAKCASCLRTPFAAFAQLSGHAFIFALFFSFWGKHIHPFIPQTWGGGF